MFWVKQLANHITPGYAVFVGLGGAGTFIPRAFLSNLQIT